VNSPIRWLVARRGQPWIRLWLAAARNWISLGCKQRVPCPVTPWWWAPTIYWEQPATIQTLYNIHNNTETLQHTIQTPYNTHNTNTTTHTHTHNTITLQHTQQYQHSTTIQRLYNTQYKHPTTHTIQTLQPTHTIQLLSNTHNNTNTLQHTLQTLNTQKYTHWVIELGQYQCFT